MATLQIGRVGVDFSLTKVSQFNQDDDTVTVRGWLSSQTNVAPRVLRDQLLGYVHGPRFEDVVPVVFSWDGTYDGFYRVVEASVEHDASGATKHHYGFGARLQRMVNYNRPRVETYISGVARSTAHVVTETWWHAVPTLASSYSAPVAITETRIGPNGSVDFYRDSTYSTETTSHYLAPANWYAAGAYIKSGGYYATGGQYPITLADWEIGNNVLKLVYSTNGNFRIYAPDQDTSGLTWGTATSGEMRVGWWDGSNWQTLTNPPVSAKITYNTPHLCALRLTYEATVSGTRTAAVNVDYSVKRGDRMASVTITSTYSTKWGLQTYNSIAGTGITGGFYQTSDDSDLNRLVVLCADALSTSLTGPSRIYLTSDGTRFRGAVGHEYIGGASTDPSRDTDLRDQWFSVMTESPRVMPG